MDNNKHHFSLTKRLSQCLCKTTISLKEYICLIGDEGAFVIPDYQRGYVWGQKKKDGTSDSVTYLVQTLKEAFKAFPQKEVFLQGITAHGDDDSYDISLVDGQQRTTFFYLLLRFLGYDGYLKIRYEIRRQSNQFLEVLDLSDIARNEEEPFQDVFFFKRTLRILKEN